MPRNTVRSTLYLHDDGATIEVFPGTTEAAFASVVLGDLSVVAWSPDVLDHAGDALKSAAAKLRAKIAEIEATQPKAEIIDILAAVKRNAPPEAS